MLRYRNITMRACCLIWMLGVALVETGFAGETGITVPEQRTHSFTIKSNGSVADVTPLFGPVREAEWAPDWSPRFIHPATGVQREGVVLTTTSAHGGDRLWLLTTYDVADGRVEYVVTATALVTTEIKICVAP